MILDKMTRQELEVFILDNDTLYNRFEESKLLSGKYTQEEMVEITGRWIFDGDETEKV